MRTILYCYQLDRYYMTSWNKNAPEGESNPREGQVYFQKGDDQLHHNSPTRFTTKEEAIAAAEEMGFTVIN